MDHVSCGFYVDVPQGHVTRQTPASSGCRWSRGRMRTQTVVELCQVELVVGDTSSQRTNAVVEHEHAGNHRIWEEKTNHVDQSKF
eukprot:12136989-Heterocapsa_arctica.AAC.1